MRTRLYLLALASLTVSWFASAQVAQVASSSGPSPSPVGRGLGEGNLASAPSPAASQSFEDYLKEIKNPTPWLSWGADLRVRNEYLHNVLSISSSVAGNEQDLIRWRGRVWTAITPITNLTLNARVAAEPRQWFKPGFAGTYKNQTGMEWRYGIFDLMNAKWTDAFGLPLTITAGRQEILLGDFYDWWLVADATPGDGSWTLFFDSIRLTFDIKEINTRLEVIGIKQSARTDSWLPAFNRHQSAFSLTEQDEQGVVLYASNKSLKNVQVDGYFIYKNDEKEFANGDNADIYTVGGKVTGTPTEHWQYSVEGAYQFGTKEDTILGVWDERDLDAFGGKAKLSYNFKDRLNNQLCLGAEFLSGDDPQTANDEMFDLLWGRWPRWSELYIYSYAPETLGKVAQMNNLIRVGPSWTLNPMKGMTASFTYNALFAPEETPTRQAAPRFSNDGNFRGHYVQALLKHQFSKHLAGHLWSEWIWEGDYYRSRDLMTFLRAEVMFTF